MSTTRVRPERPTRHRRAAAPRRSVIGTLVFLLLGAVGLGLLVYPSAATWFSDRAHATEIAGFIDRLDTIPDAESEDMLSRAEAYNRAIPEILLTDPYTAGIEAEPGTGAYGRYLEELRLPDSDVMARLRIPAIDVDLPVYHGTDDATLAKGVGHLFGTSLPVGGAGSHAVLTGHSGFVEATLFDRLHELAEGDRILVDVAGAHHAYEVTGTRTVLPTEIETLRIEPGEELLTLVTCTPKGVNTHRLLVRAERVDDPQETDAGPASIGAPAPGPGFPWWAVLFVAGALALVAILVLPSLPALLKRRRPARS